MRRYKNLIFPFLIMLLLPVSASTEVPQLAALNYKTRYDVKLGGVGIGRLFITTSETPFGYAMKIDTKTSGIVALFSSVQSVAKVQGTRREGTYLPTEYDLDADKDGEDGKRYVRLGYDENGALATRERVPGDTARYRPVVPLARLTHAPDQITGFFQLRQKLRDAMANGGKEAAIETYDGARLAATTLTVISPARIEVNGEFVDAINTVITRQPITGYTKKELKKFAEGDPVMHVYFSADDRFLPLMFTISLSYGDVKATLTQITKTN